MENYWKEYLIQFEAAILIPMFENQENSIKSEPVPLRAGKLHRTLFADFVGCSFKNSHILSFNYYGLFKPSSAVLLMQPKIGQSTIIAPVIHFSSIKIEHIETYHKDLLLDFVSFKKFLVNLRWKK